MTEFINTSENNFRDVSSEEFREYIFPGGDIVRIERPIRLHVSARNAHRVFTADGMSHYITSGWLHLRWKAKPGAAHFSF